MTNLLWVKLKNEEYKDDKRIYSFFVTVGCTLKEAVSSLEKDLGKKIVKASFNHQEVE